MKRILALSSLVGLGVASIAASQATQVPAPPTIDGTCVEIGSFKHASLVGPDKEQLDFIPMTRQDEVSYVGVSKDRPTSPAAVLHLLPRPPRTSNANNTSPKEGDFHKDIDPCTQR